MPEHAETNGVEETEKHTSSFPPESAKSGVFPRALGTFIGIQHLSSAPPPSSQRISLTPNGKNDQGYFSISIAPASDETEAEVGPLPALAPLPLTTIERTQTNAPINSVHELAREVATAVHNLRNLLSVVLSGVDFAKESMANGDRLQAMNDLDDVEIAAQKCTALTVQINDILASKENRLNLVRKEHTLSKFIESLRRNYKNQKINFINCVAGSHSFDAPRIESAIVNLISNAEKYANTGKISIVVSTDVNNNLIIEVKDEGPGLGEDPERLFEAYERHETSIKSKQGYGLGLHYCKIVCEKHGGTITAINNPERGATFRMTIPPEIRHLPANDHR